MRPVLAIIRLPCRLFQIPRDDVAGHGMEDGAVKEQGIPFSSLRVSRDFQPADREIADALKGGHRFPSMKREGDPPEDELIGRPNGSQVRMPGQR